MESKAGSMEETLVEMMWRSPNTEKCTRDIITCIRAAKEMPDFNWNFRSSNNSSLLHHAVYGQRLSVIKELFDIPAMDVNVRTDDGFAPFCNASITLDDGCMLQVFLENPRVRVDWTLVTMTHLCNPICHAATYNSLPCLEILLASFRFFPSKLVSSPESMQIEVSRLLRDYREKPFETQDRLRKKLKCEHYGPLTLFVFVVLFCDGYFTLVPETNDTQPRQLRSARFFHMLYNLPMELQQHTCNLVYSLSTARVKSKDVAWALRIFVQDAVI